MIHDVQDEFASFVLHRCYESKVANKYKKLMPLLWAAGGLVARAFTLPSGSYGFKKAAWGTSEVHLNNVCLPGCLLLHLGE